MSNPPALPTKPSSLTSVVNHTASNYTPLNNASYGPSRYGASPYNASPYASGLGNMGSYSSPYTRFGGMSSVYGVGVGGYGMYGGGGYGGAFGGGMPAYGQPAGMGAEDPNSLTNSFSQSTQATFQIIESMVGAFGGFAQMLESTYMATHSSFYGMYVLLLLLTFLWFVG